MKTLLSICVVMSGWIALEGRACEMPAMVVIPDGTRVSTQQLNNVRAGIYDYMAAMDDYLACLEDQMDAAGDRDQLPPDYVSLMINRHNAAVDEMTTVLQHFNAQAQAQVTEGAASAEAATSAPVGGAETVGGAAVESDPVAAGADDGSAQSAGAD